ncbi:D-2-hydroxyglutarate dehydrogenase, mitochondrial [Exaiptasia diaphana]|nr:D-2-hydroxyglutarate dehydrogenase, mitochondrial [Exaiptasia diaphana]
MATSTRSLRDFRLLSRRLWCMRKVSNYPFTCCKNISSFHSSLLRCQPRCFSSEVELTSVRYNVKRGNYANVTDADVTAFERILPGRVVTDPDDIAPHNTDWLQTVRVFLKIGRPLRFPGS